jgi:predicted nuclease of predicted toxin-antitoxin system
MPEPDFLADMNISPQTVSELREKSIKIVRVSEIMDVRTSDDRILNYALENNKILITYDLDFSTLMAIKGFDRPSIINLRLDNAKPHLVTIRLIEVIEEMKKEILEGVIISVDEISIRYRKLPI